MATENGYDVSIVHLRKRSDQIPIHKSPNPHNDWQKRDNKHKKKIATRTSRWIFSIKVSKRERFFAGVKSALRYLIISIKVLTPICSAIRPQL